jgi:RNA polymerase sigma-70 factor (ECF subfamily)
LIAGARLVLNISEDELIKRAKGGDAEAFCQLATAYGRRVHLLALHFCRDAHDAEDLSQEVWLKAFRAIHTFRGESSFYTWLRRVLVNTFLNHRRGHRLRLVVPSQADGNNGFDALEMADRFLASKKSDLEQMTDAKLMMERVMNALQELTPQQRLMFLLKHREGLTYVEIADAIGCSIGTVKKSIFRTLLKLRTGLGIEAEQPSLEARVAGEK